LPVIALLLADFPHFHALLAQYDHAFYIPGEAGRAPFPIADQTHIINRHQNTENRPRCGVGAIKVVTQCLGEDPNGLSNTRDFMILEPDDQTKVIAILERGHPPKNLWSYTPNYEYP
jgi:hypothetical protein